MTATCTELVGHRLRGIDIRHWNRDYQVPRSESVIEELKILNVVAEGSLDGTDDPAPNALQIAAEVDLSRSFLAEEDPNLIIWVAGSRIQILCDSAASGWIVEDREKAMAWPSHELGRPLQFLIQHPVTLSKSNTSCPIDELGVFPVTLRDVLVIDYGQRSFGSF